MTQLLIEASHLVTWPPRSPDLTPLDFCLWGWIKQEVCRERVNTRDELQVCIMNAAALIHEHHRELRNATQDVLRRAQKCIDVGGGILEHLL